jgi:hypothetical protein
VTDNGTATPSPEQEGASPRPRGPLAAYWEKYDATLARIVAERPTTFAELKAILDDFEPPSSGDAFFPDGADESLGEALNAAGWTVRYGEAVYVYRATSPTGERLTYVEGDIYEGWK